ncbi:MAG TPA: hypothetical protein VHZ78_04970 [Rhizomicrobium sp.]|jgi:hypothetical protein|nr:hypothetical protein [Rhizomicrobium sp.]
MRRWGKSLVLCAVAIALPLLSLQWDVERALCEADACQPPGNAMAGYFVGMNVSTGEIYPQRQIPINVRFYYAYEGLYPRWGLPVPLAWTLGAALPIIFAGWAVGASWTGRRRASSGN